MFSIREIFRESIGVLIAASILSLTAGVLLQSIQTSIITILPLLILLPALNDMVGDFGIIITSRFTTALYEKKAKSVHSRIVKHIGQEVIPVSIFAAIYIAVLATLVAYFRGFDFDALLFWKILAITLITTITLVFLVLIVAITGSIYIYKRKMDPDDVLIPITTSIADLGTLAVFTLLVSLLF